MRYPIRYPFVTAFEHDVFYPQNGGREGLYINIETALIYLFGPEPWLLRLPAAVFGILTAIPIRRVKFAPPI